jgi:hypothetical protein
MVATTQVRFLVGANYGVDFKKKNRPAGEIGVQGFSKLGEGFFLLMKTVRRSYPHRLSFFCVNCSKRRLRWQINCRLSANHAVSGH